MADSKNNNQQDRDYTSAELGSMIQDVLESVNVFASKVQEQFGSVQEQFGKVNANIQSVKATMVTKDYLDNKLSDIKGDLVSLVRKEDNQVKKTVDILGDHDVVTAQEKTEILALGPFAQV